MRRLAFGSVPVSFDDGLCDVDAVGGGPHVPRHPVGVADDRRGLVDQLRSLFGCHRGDLAGDLLSGHGRPTGHHRGGVTRRGEGLVDVTRGVGVRVAQPIQRVADRAGQHRGPHPMLTGDGSHGTVVGDVEPLGDGARHPSRHVGSCGLDPVATGAGGDRRRRQGARHLVGVAHDASASARGPRWPPIRSSPPPRIRPPRPGRGPCGRPRPNRRRAGAAPRGATPAPA